jgi:hypothetical protein
MEAARFSTHPPLLRTLSACDPVPLGSSRNVGSAEASWGAYRETALARNATHCGASPRVVFGVRVSGTLPQRGSLCSPNRVFRRDTGNCTREPASRVRSSQRGLSVRVSEMICERCSRLSPMRRCGARRPIVIGLPIRHADDGLDDSTRLAICDRLVNLSEIVELNQLIKREATL